MLTGCGSLHLYGQLSELSQVSSVTFVLSFLFLERDFVLLFDRAYGYIVVDWYYAFNLSYFVFSFTPIKSSLSKLYFLAPRMPVQLEKVVFVNFFLLPYRSVEIEIYSPFQIVQMTFFFNFSMETVRKYMEISQNFILLYS